MNVSPFATTIGVKMRRNNDSRVRPYVLGRWTRCRWPSNWRSDCSCTRPGRARNTCPRLWCTTTGYCCCTNTLNPIPCGWRTAAELRQKGQKNERTADEVLRARDNKRQRSEPYVPTIPPIRKQASWQKSNDDTSTNSFLPLRFSNMTPPAIFFLFYSAPSSVLLLLFRSGVKTTGFSDGRFSTGESCGASGTVQTTILNTVCIVDGRRDNNVVIAYRKQTRTAAIRWTDATTHRSLPKIIFIFFSIFFLPPRDTRKKNSGNSDIVWRWNTVQKTCTIWWTTRGFDYSTNSSNRYEQKHYGVQIWGSAKNSNLKKSTNL